MRHVQPSRVLLCLSLSAASLGSGCALDPALDDEQLASDDSEIVGGVATTIAAAPWQVAITTNGGFQFCGGSILSPNWIVTAQHCVADGSSDMRVVAGITRVSQQATGQIRAVDGVANFPVFTDPTAGRDFTLLHLATPLDLSGANARAIPLVTPADAAAGATNVGVLATVTGWGTTSEGGASSDVLRTVDVPLISNATATTQYGFTISPDQLPAGFTAGGRDSCQGDSGGPLTVAVGGVRKLAGVVSWGNGCARANFAGLYARVSTFESYVTNRTTGTFTTFLSLANLSGARNTFVHRQITVPAGTRYLSVLLAGGTGDADLYIRRASQPSTTVFDCRPFLNGNNEFCTVDLPAAAGAQTYFVSLRAFAAFSGARLIVNGVVP